MPQYQNNPRPGKLQWDVLLCSVFLFPQLSVSRKVLREVFQTCCLDLQQHFALCAVQVGSPGCSLPASCSPSSFLRSVAGMTDSSCFLSWSCTLLEKSLRLVSGLEMLSTSSIFKLPVMAQPCMYLLLFLTFKRRNGAFFF